MNTVTTLKDSTLGTTKILKVAPQNIQEREGWNERIDYGDLDSLARSIEQNGLLEPLRGFWDKKVGCFKLTDGYRRFRAINMLIAQGKEVQSVDVRTEPKGYNDELRLIEQLVANSSKEFTHVEKANVLQKLVNLGWKQKQIAERLGITQGNVSHLLSINSLPQAAKDLIQCGAVSSTEIIRLKKASKDDESFANVLAAIKEQYEETGEKVTRRKLNPVVQPENGNESSEDEAPQGGNQPEGPQDASQESVTDSEDEDAPEPENDSQAPSGSQDGGKELKPSKSSKNDILVFLDREVVPFLNNKFSDRLDPMARKLLEQCMFYIEE